MTTSIFTASQSLPPSVTTPSKTQVNKVMEEAQDGTHAHDAIPSFNAKRLFADWPSLQPHSPPTMTTQKSITFSFLPRYAPTNPFAMKPLVPPQPSSPDLLGIPLELRDQIYHYLLRNTFIQLFSSIKVREVGQKHDKHLNLLHICQQIKDEVLPLMFSKCPVQLSYNRPVQLSKRISRNLLARVTTLDVLTHHAKKVRFNELPSLKLLRFKVKGVVYLFSRKNGSPFKDHDENSDIFYECEDKLRQHDWVSDILDDKERKFTVAAECLCKPRRLSNGLVEDIEEEAFFAAVDMDDMVIFRKCRLIDNKDVIKDREEKTMSA